MNKKVSHPLFNPHKCTACWKCVEACPCNAIRKVKFLWHRHAVPAYRECKGCGLCVRVCPNGCFISNRQKTE